MNLKQSLREQAQETVPWLLNELGFEIIEDTYSSEHFGNSILTLRSSQILVQFNRDRGETATYVASLKDPTAWWLLDFVLEVANQNETIPPKLTLEAGATLLRDNLSTLAVALGPQYPRTAELLRQTSPKRVERMLRFAKAQRKALRAETRSGRNSIWNLN